MTTAILNHIYVVNSEVTWYEINFDRGCNLFGVVHAKGGNSIDCLAIYRETKFIVYLVSKTNYCISYQLWVPSTRKKFIVVFNNFLV